MSQPKKLYAMTEQPTGAMPTVSPSMPSSSMHLGHQAVDDAVRAAGAVVGHHGQKRMGALEHDLLLFLISHAYSPPFAESMEAAISRILPSTSSGVGMTPPVRP